MISGFHREVGESFTLLGYYIASSGNLLTPEDGLSQNVGEKITTTYCIITGKRAVLF